MQIPFPLTLGRLPAPFDDPGWLYEIKYDGFRARAILEQDSAGAQKDFAIVATTRIMLTPLAWHHQPHS